MKSHLYFFLLLATLIASCDTEDQPAERYYFQGDVDGRTIRIEHSDDIRFLDNTNTNFANNECRISNGTALDRRNDYFFESVAISFAELLVYDHPCDQDEIDSDFKTAFKVGTYGLWEENQEYDMPTVGVFYKQRSGKIWQSILGEQDGSQLEIIASRAKLDEQYGDIELVEVEFKVSCTLYDEEGRSIRLENGEGRYLFF